MGPAETLFASVGCMCMQADMFAETLGMAAAAAAQPAHAVVIARDAYAVGADAQRCSFEVVLTRPAVSISDDALLQVMHASVLLIGPCARCISGELPKDRSFCLCARTNREATTK